MNVDRLTPAQQRELRRSIEIVLGVRTGAVLEPRDVLKFMLVVHYLLTGDVDEDRRVELGDVDTNGAIAEAAAIASARQVAAWRSTWRKAKAV